MGQIIGDRQAGKGLDELGHGGGINVGIGRFVHRQAAQLRFDLKQPRVVVADRHGGVHGEEIEIALAVARIDKPATVGFINVEYNVVPLGQHVAGEDLFYIMGLNHLELLFDKKQPCG